MATWVYEPPVRTIKVQVVKGTSLTGSMSVGSSVLRINGQWITVDTPTPDQYLAADRWYAGGRVYTLSDAEKQELVDAGLWSGGSGGGTGTDVFLANFSETF